MLINSNFRILFSLLLLFLFSAPLTYSQSTSYLDSLDGKFALQFQISDNFNLTNFQGTTFSGKYHFSRRNAIRVGLSLDFGNADADAETNQFDSVNVAEANSSSNYFSMTLKTQYIRYFVETDNIGFYGGAGPFVTYSTSSNDSKTTGTPNDNHYTDTSNNFELGVDFIAGVEWFFTTNMSLSVEYGFNFSYKSRTSEREIESGPYSNSDQKVYSFSGNDINFGISVYF